MNTRQAVNDPVDPGPAGSRPYEMESRTESRVPFLDFCDLSGWTVQMERGAEAQFTRTREQQIWSRHVGRLTYWGTSEQSTVTIRPPASIPIGSAIDSISGWMFGNNWEYGPEPGVPMVDVSVLIQDFKGRERPIYLVKVNWKEWWLAHRKLAEPFSGASFSGIQVSGLSNPKPLSIYFDSLYLYKEDIKPLAFEPRPSRNLTLFDGQEQGLNGTGPGRLPFPTREETILPSNFGVEFQNSMREVAPGEYEFTYRDDNCEIKYIYLPVSSDLQQISAYVNGVKVCIPMHKGGVELLGKPIRSGRPVEISVKANQLRVVFELDEEGTCLAEYRLHILQKSLVVDFICRGGAATGVSLGQFREVTGPKLVTVPYISLVDSVPRVLCFGETDDPLFASVWVDWYRSNGSALWSQEWAEESTAKINGGVTYIEKTDGRRNDLYERVFLTVSPIFEETLPTIANPPTPHGQGISSRLWTRCLKDDYDSEMKRCRQLHAYGITEMTHCNHENTWRDSGESFTMRTTAAPNKGGDEALAGYVSDVKSLGWLSGLYTNYSDFATVNEFWDEDNVILGPDGDWQKAWMRCYALKPSRAVEFEAKLAPVIKKKFGPTTAYTDVHTSMAPWMRCDYDSRVPGAGTFAATYYAYGEMLLNEQLVYGPMFSEGCFQWMWAGLASGNYGWNAYSAVDPAREPLNVVFDLMKIHTLECDVGMAPWASQFLERRPGWNDPDQLETSIDQFIATTMAYGHIGWLVEEKLGIEKTCRSYYMLLQLQQRYAIVPPSRVEYADDCGRWFTVSAAIANDVIRYSRLHVVYENDLHLYVNGSAENWLVADGMTLPPWGWYARNKDGSFMEFSALLNGQRVDYVNSPAYEFLDGRGNAVKHGGLAASGSIAVRRSETTVEIINIYGNDVIGFRTGQTGRCIAYDTDGNYRRDVEISYGPDNMAWLKTEAEVRRYVFTGDGQAPPTGGFEIEAGFQVPSLGIEVSKVGDEQFRLSVHRGSSPVEATVVEVALAEGESRIQLEWDDRDRRLIALRGPEDIGIAKDTLVVCAQFQDVAVTREYSVKARSYNPVVWSVTGTNGFAWGYAFHGQPEVPGTLQGIWSPTGAAFYAPFNSMSCSDVTKYGILARPPCIGGIGYTYCESERIRMPAEECQFRAWVGLKDGTKSDVPFTFRITALDGHGRQYPLVNEVLVRPAWQEVTADLSDLRDQAIRLRFVVDAGTDPVCDVGWACMAEPRIEQKTPSVEISLRN